MHRCEPVVLCFGDTEVGHIAGMRPVVRENQMQFIALDEQPSGCDFSREG